MNGDEPPRRLPPRMETWTAADHAEWHRRIDQLERRARVVIAEGRYHLGGYGSRPLRRYPRRAAS